MFDKYYFKIIIKFVISFVKHNKRLKLGVYAKISDKELSSKTSKILP